MGTQLLQSTVKLHEKTSVLLKRTLTELVGEKTPLGVLLYRLRRRSFGGVLMFLATCSLIPGISIVSGLLIVILAIQLSIGFRAPYLPRLINKYELNNRSIKLVMDRAIPKIEYLERYIRPRWLILTLPPFTFLSGIIILCLALLVMTPLPFSNFLPGIAILIFALGFLERDGVLIAIGLLMSVLVFALGWLVIYIAIQSIGNIPLQ